MDQSIFTHNLAVIRPAEKLSPYSLLKKLKGVLDHCLTQCYLFFMPGSRDPLDIPPEFYNRFIYQLQEHFRQMGPAALSRIALNITAYADARRLDEPWSHHLATAFQNNLYLLTPWPLDTKTEDAIILSKRYGIEPRWVVKVTTENYLDIFLECNRLNIHFSPDLPTVGGTEMLKDLTERWMTDKRSRVSIFPIERFIHRCLTVAQRQRQNQEPLAAHLIGKKTAARIELPELPCGECDGSNICSRDFLLLSNGHVLLADNPAAKLTALCEVVKGYYPFLQSLMSRINIREAAEYARLFF